MYTETTWEVGVAYLPGGKKTTVTRTFYNYRCDNRACKSEHQLLKLDGENRPTEPFYCKQCNKPVSV